MRKSQGIILVPVNGTVITQALLQPTGDSTDLMEKSVLVGPLPPSSTCARPGGPYLGG